LLEAEAVGRPFIATNVPSCRVVVSDGVNGLLYQPKNAKNLAQKMAYMLSIPCDASQNMGNQRRKMVEKRFDEKLIINKYRNFLSELVLLSDMRISKCKFFIVYQFRDAQI
jgi:glycosyltransferase involved in cell wall biosynthesis